jgi:hypothetical protein
LDALSLRGTPRPSRHLGAALLVAAAVASPGCATLEIVRDQLFGEVDPTTGPPPPGMTPVGGKERRVQRSKFGPEVKVIDNDRFTGALYGFRSVRYLTFLRPVYVGGMAYGTPPLGAAGRDIAPLFGYAGVLVGLETRLPGLRGDGGWPGWTGFSDRTPSWLGLDANLHVGLTQDLAHVGPTPLGQNLSLEPSASLSVPTPFVRGSRIGLSVGYLYLPFAADYSGLTVGLRLEAKTVESRFLIDD